MARISVNPAPAVSSRSGSLARRVGLVILFAALVSVGSHIRIPIPGNPVPLTMQVVFVLLAGAFLAPWAAASAMLLFVGMGVMGAPVFSGGGAGAAYLLGPTGGYLAGFVLGAFVCSWLVDGRRDSFVRVALGMTAAVLSIHLLGILHLGFYLGDWTAAVASGLSFLLPVDALKIAAAAAVVIGTSSLFGQGAGRPGA